MKMSSVNHRTVSLCHHMSVLLVLMGSLVTVHVTDSMHGVFVTVNNYMFITACKQLYVYICIGEIMQVMLFQCFLFATSPQGSQRMAPCGHLCNEAIIYAYCFLSG